MIRTEYLGDREWETLAKQYGLIPDRPAQELGSSQSEPKKTARTNPDNGIEKTE